ncbi:MAG: hypothetical protein S4CHLAM45_03840 [Chlamydiales bacterium]|nr:hypothetical protein [Chlamydiales bacterium]MCH9619238.1 hypothetical protein [Chlamydiales bacterium]MCH9622500.1 hypothetical protein [Chlamydiales bacterium]
MSFSFDLIAKTIGEKSDPAATYKKLKKEAGASSLTELEEKVSDCFKTVDSTKVTELLQVKGWFKELDIQKMRKKEMWCITRFFFKWFPSMDKGRGKCEASHQSLLKKIQDTLSPKEFQDVIFLKAQNAVKKSQEGDRGYKDDVFIRTLISDPFFQSTAKKMIVDWVSQEEKSDQEIWDSLAERVSSLGEEIKIPKPDGWQVDTFIALFLASEREIDVESFEKLRALCTNENPKLERLSNAQYIHSLIVVAFGAIEELAKQSS